MSRRQSPSTFQRIEADLGNVAIRVYRHGRQDVHEVGAEGRPVYVGSVLGNQLRRGDNLAQAAQE